MSMHEEAENIDQSALCENEINSKSEEAMPNQKQQDPIDFLMVTRIPEKTYKFRWIIRQFSTLEKEKVLCSKNLNAFDTLFGINLVKHENGFRLFRDTPRTNPFDEDPEALVGFTTMLEYQVSATDGSGKELMKWSGSFSDNIPKIGEYKNISLEHFPDDSLILDCEVKIISVPTTEEIPIASKPCLECHGWKKLSMDLKALYQNSLDTDVTLIVETDKIRAHKSILTARSTVFKKIFHHDMEEAEQNSVVITDVDFSALQRLVEYLYTGVITDGENKDMNLQELYDLYYASDKYEVMDLREMTGNTLLGRIQMNNASKILVWADRHNDNNLKSRVMNFIRLNFEAVTNTDTWESCALHHPRLAVEVFNFCTKKLKTGEK